MQTIQVQSLQGNEKAPFLVNILDEGRQSRGLAQQPGGASKPGGEVVQAGIRGRRRMDRPQMSSLSSPTSGF